MKYRILSVICLMLIFIENTNAQGFREKYFEQIVPLIPEQYKEVIEDAEISIKLGKSFEDEGIRLRSMAEQEEQTENTVESKDLNKTIKKENKLYKKSTETYAVAADLYIGAVYLKYNVYSKILTPLENKSKPDKKKSMFQMKKEAGIFYNRANFSMTKTKKTENIKQQYEFYVEAVTFALQALNSQAEEFRIYNDWEKQ